MVHPQTQLLVFVLFFGVSALAIAVPRWRFARRAFTWVFVTLLLWFGLTGDMAWPFFGWHLYAYEGKTDLTFYEVRLADDAGRELRLDARAAPPTMSTPLTRIGDRMAHLEPERAAPIAAFLVDRAGDYRQRVEREGIARRPWWQFPPHQSGYRWTRDRLTGLGPFRELRVYRIEATFSPDGREVLERREQLAARFVVTPEGGEERGAGDG